MRISDEYTNILRYMYITRFNGDPSRTGASHEDHPIPEFPTPTLESGRDLINSGNGQRGTKTDKRDTG